MSSTPATRGLELRTRLRKAPPGAVIDLEQASEYQGPFVLDKPVTLRGSGETTQVFAKRGPAILILSPGVRLEHLGITDAANPVFGVCLVAERDAHPQLVNVVTNGRTATMTREHLIDMGELLPDQQASSFLEVEVSGPSSIKCTDTSAKWLRVHPEALPAAGKYLIQLFCDAKILGKDALAIGTLEIVTGTTTTIYWVSPHVLSAPLTSILTGNISLLMGKDQHVRFNDGFIVGKNRFPGVSAASSMADRQAILLKEACGAWAIFQPWTVTTPTTLNGQRLALGQRILLQAGDVIRAGSLDLTVEAYSGGGAYNVDKPAVDLGTPGSPSPDSSFQLRYNGSGKDKPRFVATVPWLQLTPSEFEIKKGEIKAVQVSLSPAAAALPPMQHRERGAILIVGKDEILSLDAIVDVKLEPIIPAISDSLKFGTVTDWSLAAATVVVSNTGTKEWKPAVKVSQEWLAPESADLVVLAGKKADLMVRLNSKVESLPPTSNQTATVLLEGDGVSRTINVQLRLQLPVVDPILESAPLDFKELDDWEKASAVTVIVRNKGNKEWRATARATEPWLDIQPAGLIVPAGAQKTLIVQLNGKLPIGTHQRADAIVIEGGGKSLAIPARVTLKSPTTAVEIFPRQVDFGLFRDWRNAKSLSVEFKNRGGADWVGSVICSVPWLEIIPAGPSWRCGAKSAIAVTLRVNDKIPEGAHDLPGAVLFTGPGGPYRIQVVAHYRPEPVIPALPSLDFGEVAGWDTTKPIRLPISNDGNRDWTAAVKVGSTAGWLSANPETLVVPQGGQAVLEVRLNSALKELSAGAKGEPRAIVLTGHGIERAIEVKLSLPPTELLASPGEAAFQLQEGSDTAGARQTVQISNTGRRDWAGRVDSRVPWLSVSPPQASIRAGGNQVLQLQLTEAVRSLKTGEHVFGAVIGLEGASATIGARVNIQKLPPPEVPDVDPVLLDFGRMGETMAPDRHVTISARSDWAVTVEASENWFESTRSTLSGRAGQPVVLPIRLAARAGTLSEGVSWGELRFQFANGTKRQINVKVEKVETVPDFAFDPPIVEFRCDPAAGLPPPQTVRLTNMTSKEWAVALSVADSWLSVSPPSLRCPPRGGVGFQVGLMPGVSALKYGSYPRDLTLRAGKHSLQYTIQTILEADPIVILVTFVNFRDVSEADWDRCPPVGVVVGNKGVASIRVEAALDRAAGKWLEPPPSIVVPAKGERTLQLKLKPGFGKLAKPGDYNGNLMFPGGRKLPVSLRFVQGARETKKLVLPEAVQPRLQLEGDLTFADVPPARWRDIPPKRVRVTNPGNLPWLGHAMALVDWLTVQPGTLNIPPGETLELEVRLKNAPFNTSLVYDSLQAIQIGNDSQSYKLHARVGASSAGTEGLPVPEIAEPPVMAVGPKTSGPDERLLVKLPPPPGQAMTVDPLALDFGTVGDWSQVAPLTVTVTNGTADLLHGVITAQNWLHVTPNEISCPAGLSQSFQVSLKKRLSAFEKVKFQGAYAEQRAILLSIGGMEFPISVSVKTI